MEHNECFRHYVTVHELFQYWNTTVRRCSVIVEDAAQVCTNLQPHQSHFIRYLESVWFQPNPLHLCSCVDLWFIENKHNNIPMSRIKLNFVALRFRKKIILNKWSKCKECLRIHHQEIKLITMKYRMIQTTTLSQALYSVLSVIDSTKKH